MKLRYLIICLILACNMGCSGSNSNGSEEVIDEDVTGVSLSSESPYAYPDESTGQVIINLKLANASKIKSIFVEKVGSGKFSQTLTDMGAASNYQFKYKLTDSDPEQFQFLFTANLVNNKTLPVVKVQVDNRAGLYINQVTRLARVTGKPIDNEGLLSPNKTASKWNVGGCDLGIIWEMTPGRYGIFFGDTFGSDFRPNTSVGGGNGGSWRSNVLAFSTDKDLADGLTIDNMAVDANGNAREIVPGGKNASGYGDWTSIPTGAIRDGNTDYVHYMNIRNWTGWVTNYSALYKSIDNGQSWAPVQNVKFSFSSNFGQVGYYKKDGYVYMIGTRPGRSSSACLARIPEGKMEDQASYEYWNGNTKEWVTGNEDAATIIIDGTVGELSFIYNKFFKKWIIAYFNSEDYNITMRYADEITGPWSQKIALATGGQYAQLYGSYFHPLSAQERTLYFTMSMWVPYNTFLMKVELGGNPR